MSNLARLGQAYGIAPRYHDIWGNLHDVSEATTRALLATMGLDAATDAEVEAALEARDAKDWRRRLAPLIVVHDDVSSSSIRLTLPAAITIETLEARVVDEAGEEYRRAIVSLIDAGERLVDGEPWRAFDVGLAFELPADYYRLALVAGDDVVAEAPCAVVPRRCYRPHALRPTWGAAVQLYGVRSERNWGIGDFTDLAGLVERFGECGAGIVGVNPLHALFPHNAAHTSPYSPSSRLFVNPLYLDVEAIAELADCAPAQALVASTAFRARKANLREAELIDYPGVAQAKREVLDLLYASFRERHLRRRTRRGRDFRAFRRAGGEALARHALFEAIQEHHHARDPTIWGWPAWPHVLRDPRSPAVARFAAEHAERVDYYVYLQWQAELQRAAVALRATSLSIGLYNDLAVSVDRGGAESWAHQDLYALTASIGAPPDAFNREGQDWGLPPLVPLRLREAGYAPFLAMLRANMRHAGALRIDHVMSLMRLFWIPPGGKPVDGAYVHYPFAELVGLLALESQRSRCMVIGEDLGTVPDEVRRTLVEADVLSYRVLLFERDQAGTFRPPGAYPEAALATGSTHDLPTLAGWWEGHDIDVRFDLGLIASEDERQRQQDARAQDRHKLVRAMEAAGFVVPSSDGPMTPALMASIAAFVAATPCVIEVLQLEDLLLVRDQANVPGTIDAHPNWRRKLPVPIEEALDSKGFRSLAAYVAAHRPAG